MINVNKYDIINIFAELLNTMGINAYLVGGAVRDIIIGINPVDFDFVVEVDETKHQAAVEQISKKLNCKYDFNSYYHTAKFYYGGYDIDFVMARQEYYNDIAAKPRVYSSNITNDLKRRDFTINTMAMTILQDKKFKIIDPFNGIRDIENKKIRVLHDKSFRDDPTRVFRGIKYAARFGFYFEENTKKLIEECALKGYIKHLKSQRIKQEILLLLNEHTAINSFKLLSEYKILDSLTSSRVILNFDLEEDIFNNLDNNRKIAVLLYRNPQRVLEQIKDVLDLGKNVLDYIVKICELENMMLMEDRVLYKFLFKNQNNLDDNILKTLFYKDHRILQYIRYKGKVKVNPRTIIDTRNKSKAEYILDRKIEIFNFYLDGGYNNGES